MSQYLAILGRQPELGLAELEAQFGPEAVQPFGRHALLSQMPQIDRLGGTQKIGRVIYQGPSSELLDVLEIADLPLSKDGKTIFGLSYYGAAVSHQSVAAAGLGLKRRLPGSLRLVTPTSGTALSAAQMLHNRILERGFELLIVATKNHMVLAITTAFQDIEAYGRRDFDRPARSAKVGMLPPKLAQILVNTTHAPLVADPFCGTGVVLQESLLLGRRASGSDIAADMVTASRTNLEWLQKQFGSLPPWEVSQADALTWAPPPGCVVVTEGYLGPNFSRPPRRQELEPVQQELGDFYRAILKAWAAPLPAGAEVTICLPAWRIGPEWLGLDLIDVLPDLGYTLKAFSHCDSRQLRYARADQTVGRQILLLTRN